MNERIKQLRKYLHLSGEKFGKKIGLSKAVISKMENANSLPSDQTIMLICTAFNVNEQWLRTGKGEMFEKKDESLEDLFSDASDLEKSIIAAYLSIDADLRDQVIVQFLNSIGKKDLASKFESEVEQIEKTVKIDKDETITAKVKKRKQK